ncbi:KH domain-containing protein HEN4-like [Chenopodium quinoa]|uniref:KH domain-containing protein HEN4-like n=1 Tax=Chenopodium quinoa TaxID=63459 RepID=UPI000B79174A|nr:KH domain-containing protein HEN4-like [Chenopodium quinoa]
MEPQFSLKRHHSHSLSNPTLSSSSSTPPSQQLIPSENGGETQFRILCPSAKVGGVIGKGGAVIRQLRDDTGARIRIVDDLPPFSRCDERVIHIIADSKNPNPNSGEEREEGSIAQAALVKVFERILKVDEERSEKNESEKMEDERRENNGNGNGGSSSGNGGQSGHIVCRLLAPSNQVGCVLGRGGKIVEKIRQESGAQVRVLPREQLPACASPGEELIQMAGNFQAVKKALLSVSSCLQEHPKADMFQGPNLASQTDSFPQRGAHAADHSHRIAPEDDVVFRLLCQASKIGSLIGKGGSIVRAIQNETGASIKIGDTVSPDSDERVVFVSARESMDLKHSAAQDAVIRVHSRIAEVGFEPGAAVIARLLVHSQQIGCLLGKGGLIIAEMRRLTGASIRIFGREQGVNPNIQNDEVVQVIGSLQSVQDALFQITSRLRDVLFPPKQHLSHVSSSPYFTTYQELPSPSFRPRHDQASPGHYHSPVGLPHAYDNRSAGQGQAHSSFPHEMDRVDGPSGEHDHHQYGSDRASYGLSFEKPASPKVWHPQAADYGNPSRYSDTVAGSSSMVAKNNESGQMPMVTSVEIVVPQILLPHVYGENKTNIGHITQFSGADVIVHDPNPGATEGRVVISGTPSQLHTAQSLVQAFIFCSQAF